MEKQENKLDQQPEKETSPTAEAEKLSCKRKENYLESVRYRWLLPILALVLCLALGLGLLLPRLASSHKADELTESQLSQIPLPAVEALDDKEANNQIKKLQIIYQFLKENYYRELSDEEMIEAMYAGLLNQMDSPYTFYLDPEANTALNESMQGEYYGIGAQVGQREDGYYILDVFDDSPALKAGLRNGDKILSVDDVSVAEFADVSILASKVRGEEGSKVAIEVYRETDKEDYVFEVTRGKVTTSSLQYEMLEDGIAYVRIMEFSQGVAKNFIHALDDVAAQDAQTVIFDLRNNGGGYVSEVTKMLDYLLPEADLAVAKGRSMGQEFTEAWTSDKFVGVPENWQYTILINENSASASELFTGCLRDLKDSTIVGKKSFGKGVGSITYELSDGSAMQITNFHYYLPKGDSVEQNGLDPDIEVDLDDKFRGLPVSMLEENDKQLVAALDHARSLVKANN